MTRAKRNGTTSDGQEPPAKVGWYGPVSSILPDAKAAQPSSAVAFSLRLPHRSYLFSALWHAARGRRAAAAKRWQDALDAYERANECARSIRRAPQGVDVCALKLQIARCAGMIGGIMLAKEGR